MRLNPSQYIRDEVIDFAKYMQSPPEAARILPASHWRQALVDRFHNPQVRVHSVLPWSKTHADIQIRPKEVSIWAGFNGHGKSLLLSNIALGLMAQGERICVASFEMPPEKTLERKVRQFSGVSEPSIKAIDSFIEFCNEKLWLYDQFGMVKSDRVIAVIRYCAEELGITQIVIDSLMKCGLPAAGDSAWNQQKHFIDQLCSVAKDTGMHIHLVAHMRKGDSEFQKGDKMDVKGAGEITDQVDNLFTIWRNKPKEDESQEPNPDQDIMKQPDVLLRCAKQRHGEWEGKIALWFDKKSMQYVAFNGARPISFTTQEAT